MVQQHAATNLNHLTVDGSKLMVDGRIIAQTPTAIAELARLDNRIFVILDGDPNIQGEQYIGENLWCFDHAGTLLWKAENLLLHNWGGRLKRNAYRGLRILGTEFFRLQPGTMEDRQVIYLDPATGRVLPNDQTPWRPEDPRNQVLATAKLFHCIMAQ